MTFPSGGLQVGYGYDAANNLTIVTDWNSNQTQYAYDNAGQLTTATLASSTGVVGTDSYDNADRLTGINWVKGGSQTLASAAYTLDSVGNRTQRVDQLGTHTYGYDNLYRLTSVTYPGPTTDTYTYDAAGNRLTKNATTYTYDAADRLAAVGGTAYTFDNNGNQAGRGSDSFNWDTEDRLTSATVSGATTSFAYNGDGLRDSLTVGANTTSFTWDVGSGLPQVLDDGSFKYVYGLGRIAEVGPGATTHNYLADGLGSVMALVDASGAVVNTYDYDVFGAVRSQIGSQANAFTFTGEQTDTSTGLEYLRARYYDVGTGRFISLDIFTGVAGLPISQNRYLYSRGNVTNLNDPLGFCVFGAPCPSPLKKAKEWAGDRVDDMAAIAEHTFWHPSALLNGNIGNQVLAGLVAALSSCDRMQKEGGIVIYSNCGGLGGLISRRLLMGNTFTLGSFIFSPGSPNPELLAHEIAHTRQYDVLGGAFLPVYAALEVAAIVTCEVANCDPHRVHPLEFLADEQAGVDVR